MAETPHLSHNLEVINHIMTNQISDLLKDKLTELKGDIDPKIFRELSCVNHSYGRGYQIQNYEGIVDRIKTLFREYCTPVWYPNNAVEQPLDVSGYSGPKGNLKLKTELMNVFGLTSVRDNINAKYNALKEYSNDKVGDDLHGHGVATGHDLNGFGVAKFRKWMTKDDQNDAPPDDAKILILSFIEDTRNPKNKDEEEYKEGRVRAMCFALLLMEELTKARPERYGDDSNIKILGAAMIHALTTHGSQPLWEHICDVIYPPKQHKEETILFDYMAACTMGDHHLHCSVRRGFYRPSCSCSARCVCNEIHVSAEDALGFFLNNNVIESVRKWETDHSTT